MIYNLEWMEYLFVIGYCSFGQFILFFYYRGEDQSSMHSISERR